MVIIIKLYELKRGNDSWLQVEKKFISHDYEITKQKQYLTQKKLFIYLQSSLAFNAIKQIIE